jgi:hypothetical protein
METLKGLSPDIQRQAFLPRIEFFVNRNQTQKLLITKGFLRFDRARAL